MSGVMIAGELLQAYQPLTAVVPAEWIVAWVLPQGAPADAIVVDRVSRVPLQMLDRQPLRRVNERVQVTIRAGSGLKRAQIEGLAVAATADRSGTIAGFSGVSVLYASAGAEFMDDPATIFLTSFDLRVSFLEPA